MRRRLLLCCLAVLALVATALSAPAAQASGAAARSTAARSTAARSTASLPYVRDGQTVPTYSYADAIHESVFVQAPFDSDGDGKPDRIAVDIDRPRTPSDVHVPVIMDASPYYQCCGRGNQDQVKTYYGDGTIASMPLFYDNYFVPRGYAVAQVDVTGTSRSTGCGDMGGPSEIAGIKAVIQWMNGKGTAYDLAGKRASASWTDGKVGMIGKSWDGTLTEGVAATGVSGLKTIVPISAISSWYDYTRFGGVLRSPGYVQYLDSYVGGRPAGVCDAQYARQQNAAADSTGNLNAFWDRRNYRLHADRVHASVFVSHGINDLNVTTNQFGRWWALMGKYDVPRKIWLSQDGHVDPFDYRRTAWVHTLHRWFDRWLQGLSNGIMNEPQATIQHADGSWSSQSRWPAAGTRPVSVPLAKLGGTAERAFVDHPRLTEAQATSHPTTSEPGRAVFLSGALPEALSVAGNPSVTLRVKVNRPTTELTAKLVDYGSQRRIDYESAGEGISTLKTKTCWGESSDVDSACYFRTVQDYTTSNVDVLSRGWLDAAHHETLSRTTPLTPGRWYTITVPIDTTNFHVAAGHRIGLVLTQSDEENTSPKTTGATIHVDPRASSLQLPVTLSYRIPTGPAQQSAPLDSPVARQVQPHRIQRVVPRA